MGCKALAVCIDVKRHAKRHGSKRLAQYRRHSACISIVWRRVSLPRQNFVKPFQALTRQYDGPLKHVFGLSGKPSVLRLIDPLHHPPKRMSSQPFGLYPTRKTPVYHVVFRACSLRNLRPDPEHTLGSQAAVIPHDVRDRVGRGLTAAARRTWRRFPLREQEAIRRAWRKRDVYLVRTRSRPERQLHRTPPVLPDRERLLRCPA